MRATVISSAVWRLAHDRSGYCRTPPWDLHQKGAPEACKKEKPTHMKSSPDCSAGGTEIAGSFYGPGPGDGEETSMQMQKVGAGRCWQPAQIKGSLIVSQQEFKREKNCETEKMSGMSMENVEWKYVYLSGALESEGDHVALANLTLVGIGVLFSVFAAQTRELGCVYSDSRVCIFDNHIMRTPASWIYQLYACAYFSGSNSLSGGYQDEQREKNAARL